MAVPRRALLALALCLLALRSATGSRQLMQQQRTEASADAGASPAQGARVHPKRGGTSRALCIPETEACSTASQHFYIL
jgi:hypothetical protein